MPENLQDNDAPSPTVGFGSLVLQLLLLIFSVWLLEHVDILNISNLELLGVLLLLAIPIAFYQLEFILLTHRLLLDAATKNHSHSRALLWRGYLLKTFVFVSSVFLAWLLLLMSQDLHPYYWNLLYAEAIALFLFYVAFNQHWLKREVRSSHRPILSRKVTQYVLILLLTGCFIYLGYAVVGVSDLRGQTFDNVWTEGFTESKDAARSHLVGVVAGLVNAISQVSWLAMQLLDQQLAEGTPDLMIWIPFLLSGAIKAAIIVLLHLGLIGLVEWKARNNFRVLGHSPAARLFMGTFLIIVAFSTWLDYKVANTRISDRVADIPEAVMEKDPCANLPDEVQNFSADELVNIAGMREAVLPTVMEEIQTGSNRIYKGMGPHVDDYLDWFYSLTTQLKLQALLVADLVNARPKGENSRVTELISKNVNHYIISTYGEHVKSMNKRIAGKTNQLLYQQFEVIEQRLQSKRHELEAYQAPGCTTPALNDIDQYIEALSISGPGLDPVLGTGAAFVSATFAAKAAGKKLAGSVAGKSVSKVVTKLGLSAGSKAVAAGTATAGGATTGVLCGPAAPACAILGGVAAAVIFELAFNEADEALTRKQARSDIMYTMLNMSILTQVAYKEAYKEQIEASITRTFQPNFVPGKN